MDYKQVPQDEKGGSDVLPLPTQSTQPRSRRARRFRLLTAGAIVSLLGYQVLKGYSHDRTHGRIHRLADPDQRGKLTVKEAEELFLTIPNTKSAIATSKEYATLPHLAGSEQDLVTAKSFLEFLERELGIISTPEASIYDAGSPESQNRTHSVITATKPYAWIDKYFPVMNTPLGRSLDILDDNGQSVWKAQLEEDEIEGDPAGKHAKDIGAWHGLSKGGSVEGKVVYVNYGRKVDFDALIKAGTNFTNTIALVRYGGVFRGLKVKAAAEAGCVGTLIYSDPRDDGSVTVENGYEPYPKGPARNPTSVQRGSVQYLSSYPGDPTTPGEPAYPNATRLEGGNIPTIPSIPISWYNAQRLLEEIDGPTFHLNGALSKRPIRFVNEVNTTVIPIWNTMGVIPGHIKDEIVVLGNHRDAWVNGAADPTSGTVSVNEIIRGLGVLLRAGWTPLRTILIASWDAEEYGLIGSTEWTEDFPDFIQKYVVAYLNLDVSTSGSRFHLAGSPSLANLIKGVAQEIPHPTDEGRTLWDARTDSGPFKGPAAEIGIDHVMVTQMMEEMDAAEHGTGVGALGSGSDFTGFLQRLGIAAIDGGFGGTLSDAVYHYHSVYDSHAFQERYADPGFHRHVAVAKYLGLVTLRLANAIVLPLNTTQYSLQLGDYLEKVQDISSSHPVHPTPSFTHLAKSISRVQHASRFLDIKKAHAERALRHALYRIGKAKARNARGRSCSHRHFQKTRTFIKSLFGVKPYHHDEHKDNEHRHAHEKRVNLQKVRVGKAGSKWNSKREEDSLERRASNFKKVRVGKAGAEWNKRSSGEEEHSVERRKVDFGKVRVGKAGAGSFGKRSEEEVEVKEKEGLEHHEHHHREHHHHRFDASDADVQIALSLAGFSNLEEAMAIRGVPRGIHKLIIAVKAVRSVNQKLAKFEQGFIHEGGIKEREWYRHLGVAPGKWLGYGATTLPGLTEAIEIENNSTLVAYEAGRLEHLFNKLAHKLYL